MSARMTDTDRAVGIEDVGPCPAVCNKKALPLSRIVHAPGSQLVDGCHLPAQRGSTRNLNTSGWSAFICLLSSSVGPRGRAAGPGLCSEVWSTPGLPARPRGSRPIGHTLPTCHRQPCQRCHASRTAGSSWSRSSYSWSTSLARNAWWCLRVDLGHGRSPRRQCCRPWAGHRSCAKSRRHEVGLRRALHHRRAA